MSIDPQAAQLNEVIRQVNPAVERMLSARGRAIFFPKLGVLSQSAEATGKDINATIGIALEDDGGPVALQSIAKSLNLPAGDAFPYAPSPGRPDIRKLWREMLIKKNPGLAGRSFGQPVVTAALTHGLSMAGYLFCEPGDTVILPDLYWENYDLIFGNAYGASLKTFPTYTTAGGFDVEALKTALAGAVGKKVVLLNFPNNPSGYTPTVAEAHAIVGALTAEAARGSADVPQTRPFIGKYAVDRATPAGNNVWKGAMTVQGYTANGTLTLNPGVNFIMHGCTMVVICTDFTLIPALK